MKLELFIAATLLLNVTAFAQNPDKPKNEHGTKVSTVAKSETDADVKGIEVSETASAKSKASAHRKNKTAEERQQMKTDREAAREERKQAQQEFVADVKANEEPRTEEQKAAFKAELEAHKELAATTRDQAKEAEREAKAERKDAEITLNGKVEKARDKSNRPAKIKTGAKARAEVKVRRPNIKTKVHGSAGLGLGNL